MRVLPDEALAAITIRMEAEGEPYTAKVGVAEAILRRMRTHYFSDGTVGGTVLRRSQFSAWCMNTSADVTNRTRCLLSDDTDPIYHDCLRAWDAAKAGSENAPGAVLFYATTISPPEWAIPQNFVCQFGKIRFYRA